MANWTFLSNHGRALLCITQDPGVRLRDVAAELGITERRAYDIVVDLTDSGYVVKSKSGRRNQYQVRAHLPLPEPTRSERTIGDLLGLLAGTDGQQSWADAARPSAAARPSDAARSS
jgi:hypothetical protein